ncbi:MAG: hypothetical protein JO235_06030 [Chroococcidiopsidaceae cyanobacterium CP_BM_RX_35]|nr:hypothetical protein [Chroococcidiopsidaceae cyanobacterium CP_BM_RX_35]
MPKCISYLAVATKPLCFVEALLFSAALLLCVQTPSRAGQAFHPLTAEGRSTVHRRYTAVYR